MYYCGLKIKIEMVQSNAHFAKEKLFENGLIISRCGNLFLEAAIKNMFLYPIATYIC